MSTRTTRLIPRRRVGGISTLCLLVVALAGTLPSQSVAAARGSARPTLFRTLTNHGQTISPVFSVRPRTVVVDSADGGELVIHWTEWTQEAASGFGTAHPDHGVYPIRVRATDPEAGTFLRFKITGRLDGRWRADQLVLASLLDEPTWARSYELSNPRLAASLGLTPYD
jgi:hypothetical protein